jgi:predicted dinucleotide-utilizing enzyme
MDPILLIHGYSSEGRDNSAKKIYGSLPAELRKSFGKQQVREINLGRWISLSDGVTLDDVSYAMDRALHAEHADLLKNGFHIIIHSTGALVVRNWIKKFSR